MTNLEWRWLLDISCPSSVPNCLQKFLSSPSVYIRTSRQPTLKLLQHPPPPSPPSSLPPSPLPSPPPTSLFPPTPPWSEEGSEHESGAKNRPLRQSWFLLSLTRVRVGRPVHRTCKLHVVSFESTWLKHTISLQSLFLPPPTSTPPLFPSPSSRDWQQIPFNGGWKNDDGCLKLPNRNLSNSWFIKTVWFSNKSLSLSLSLPFPSFSSSLFLSLSLFLCVSSAGSNSWNHFLLGIRSVGRSPWSNSNGNPIPGATPPPRHVAEVRFDSICQTADTNRNLNTGTTTTEEERGNKK